MRVIVRILVLVLLAAAALAAAFYWNPLWFKDEQVRLHLGEAHVHSDYIQANGHRLHYFEAAPPDGSPGIPLLLIHGLGSRGEDWSPMIPSLSAAGFHVYAPDLLGFGRSDKPDAPYSISQQESIVLDFLNAIHLQHTDVAGWSMGGWVAAKLALDHPALVERLILYDSAGITYKPAFARDAFVPTDTASLDRLIALLSPDPQPLPGFAARAVLRQFKDTGWIIQRSMDSMLSGTDLLDTRLHAITQPTLIVWGTEDQLIPITVGETMHRDIPHSVFEPIPGCGHLAPGQCAKPVLKITLEFLTTHPPMEGNETDRDLSLVR